MGINRTPAGEADHLFCELSWISKGGRGLLHMSGRLQDGDEVAL